MPTHDPPFRYYIKLIAVGSVLLYAFIDVFKVYILIQFWILHNLAIDYYACCIVYLVNSMMLFVVAVSMWFNINYYNQTYNIIIAMILVLIPAFNLMTIQVTSRSLQTKSADISNNLCNKDMFPNFYNMETLYQTFSNKICSEECPCNMDDTVYDLTKSPYKDAIKNINENKYVVNIMTCNEKDFVKNIVRPSIYSTEVGIKFYMYLEYIYGCAGICSEVPYFLFRNINDIGAPKSSCKDKIINDIKNMKENMYETIVYNSYVSIALLFILGVLNYSNMFAITKEQNNINNIVDLEALDDIDEEYHDLD